jgi:hypothetical protein
MAGGGLGAGVGAEFRQTRVASITAVEAAILGAALGGAA